MISAVSKLVQTAVGQRRSGLFLVSSSSSSSCSRGLTTSTTTQRQSTAAVTQLRDGGSYYYEKRRIERPHNRHHNTNNTVPFLVLSQQQPQQLCQCRMLHSTPTVWSDAAAQPAALSSTVDDAQQMPPILWTTHRLKPEQLSKVDAVFHKILWLDIFETAMLNELVNERLGLTLTPKQRRQLGAQMEARASAGSGLGGASAGPAEPEVEVGPVLVDLKLAGFDAKAKIKVIKEVRSILGLGLKEAKEMVEGAPVVLQKGLKQEVADELKAKLEAAGAQIELL